jgi:hypothetical protein
MKILTANPQPIPSFDEWLSHLIFYKAEAVEVYPAESRLLDTDNFYHLWRVDQEIGFNVGRHVW